MPPHVNPQSVLSKCWKKNFRAVSSWRTELGSLPNVIRPHSSPMPTTRGLKSESTWSFGFSVENVLCFLQRLMLRGFFNCRIKIQIIKFERKDKCPIQEIPLCSEISASGIGTMDQHTKYSLGTHEVRHWELIGQSDSLN